LAIEEHFYLLWPSILAIIGIRRSRWVAVAGIVLTLIWRSWSASHVYSPVQELQRTDMRLDGFLWACLVAILIYDRGPLWSIVANRTFHVGVVLLMAAAYAIALIHPMQLTKLALQSFLMPLVAVPTVFLPGYALSRVLEWAPLRW